ncbi:MAG: Smr/MutS family protein [Bacteroidota bacterium]
MPSSMRFNKGEKVLFLKEVGEGIVKGYDSDHFVIVEDDTGFENIYPEDQLVEIKGTHSDSIPEEAKELAEGSGNQAIGVNNSNEFADVVKSPGCWEVDLHTHMLMDSERGMTSGELLNYQLAQLNRYYLKAREKRIRKLIIIHGVGQGVLKNEVRHFLEGREGVAFYDADFREYGKGATEVEIYYQ